MYRKTFESFDSEETVIAPDAVTRGKQLTALADSLTAQGHQVVYTEGFTAPNPKDGTINDFIGKVYYRKGVIV